MRIRRPMPQRPSLPPSPRSGVTLLEIVLALALTLVLVGVLNTSLDLYSRVSTVGRAETERSQLARTILHTMARDIRSVVYRAPSEDDAADADPESEEEAVTTMEVVDPAAAYSGASVGLFGDSEMLVLHVSRPVRGLSYSTVMDAVDVTERTSDLHSVAYFLSVPGATGLQGALGTASEYRATSEEIATEGLARLEGDRLAMDLADQQGSLDALAAQTNLMAAEVDYLAFRYFDGVEWLDTWDSVISERLPVAVEIEIGVRDADDPVDTFGRQYRLVVALPVAEPYVPQLAL